MGHFEFHILGCASVFRQYVPVMFRDIVVGIRDPPNRPVPLGLFSAPTLKLIILWSNAFQIGNIFNHTVWTSMPETHTSTSYQTYHDDGTPRGVQGLVQELKQSQAYPQEFGQGIAKVF